MFIIPKHPATEELGDTDVIDLPIDEPETVAVDHDSSALDNMLGEKEDQEQNVEFSNSLKVDIQASESLLMEIEHLSNLAIAIETHGISPGMMMVADRDGLLASTFIGKIPATESMVGPYRPDSATSQMALEGIIDAIKNKTAEWAAKAATMAKSLVGKVGGAVKSAISWAGSFAKSIATKTWNATKAAGAVVKAHPYKTAAAAVAALVTIAGIITMIGTMPAQASEIASWRSRVTAAMKNLKMPGGKFVAKPPPLNAKNSNVTPEILKWAKETFPAQPAKLSALGWTKNALSNIVTSMGNALSKVYNAVVALAKSLPSMIAKVAAMSSAKPAIPAKEDFDKKTAFYVAGFALVGLVFGWTVALLAGAVAVGVHLIKQNAILVANASLDGNKSASV